MRTARRVIVCLLVLLAGEGLAAQQGAPPAQGSVDNDVTITGNDDSLIPVPAPPRPDADPLELPALDSSPAPAFVVPPVIPPVVPPAVPPAPTPALTPTPAPTQGAR